MDCLLKFLEFDGNKVYWQFTLSEKEFELLSLEIEHYNSWIKLLTSGLAPLSSYEQPSAADDQYLVRNRKRYDSLFPITGSRGFYEKPYYGFELIDTNSKDLDEWAEEAVTKYRSGKLQLEGKSSLSDLITKPLDYCSEFTMGYRLLPMTRKLLT